MVNKMDCFRFDRTVGPPCANTASAIKAWSQWLRRDVVMVLLRDHWAIAYRFKEFGRADVLHSWCGQAWVRWSSKGLFALLRDHRTLLTKEGAVLAYASRFNGRGGR